MVELIALKGGGWESRPMEAGVGSLTGRAAAQSCRLSMQYIVTRILGKTTRTPSRQVICAGQARNRRRRNVETQYTKIQRHTVTETQSHSEAQTARKKA